MKHFIPGDTVGHHNVGRRMGLREHILDQLAGPDIPVRNIMIFHSLDPFVTETFSFTDTLHDGKCQTAFHPFSNKVDHNIISRTDRGGNGRRSVLNQYLGISKPYVRTMRKSRNTYQVGKIFRLGIN